MTTKSIPTMTLEEASSKKRPQGSQLKIFNSVAHIWILDEKCSKLDSKWKKKRLIFAMYSDHHKANILIDIEIGKRIFNRDVMLDEHANLFQSTSVQKSSLKFLAMGCDSAAKPTPLPRSPNIR